MAEKVELELNLKGGDKAVKTLAQLEQELDDARQAIKEVEVGSDAFNELATKVQKASSEVKTLEKQMEGLEPQQKAEAFLKMGEGIAGGFAIAQGALAIVGVESENLEKIQAKVQGAIAIAMGARMIAEAALMATTAKRIIVEKASTVATVINTVATEAATKAMKILGISVRTTSLSFKALKAAIISSGIGLLIEGLIMGATALYNWISGTEDAEAAAEAEAAALQKANDARQRQINLLKQAVDFRKQQFLLDQKGATAQEKQLSSLRLQLKGAEDYLNTLIESGEKGTILANVEERRNNILKKIINKEEELSKIQERKAQKLKDIADLEKLQEEAKRLTLERIADEETRELALLQFEKDLQLEKIEDATNFEEQRLLIEQKYARLRADVQAKYVQDTVDGLETINTEGQNILDELQRKNKEREDQDQADYEQREKNKADFVASLDQQMFGAAKALGGKNKKLQQKLAIAETAFFTGKSIVRALADIPAPFGIAQALIHGAMGAAQIANIRNETIGDVNGTEADVQQMIPASTGAFELGNIQQQPVKAFVVESEITDSQAQMADINRRSTI